MGTIKPSMGIANAPSITVGDALYPRTRQAVLRLFFSHPDKRFLQKEVIRQLGVGSGAVQRELDRLSKAEILVRTVDGRQTYFQANPASPILEELRSLVRKTFGVAYVLQEALRPIAKSIELAFIFGSVASGTEKSASDVDLMVVSDDVSLSDLIPAIREAEHELNREVNPSLYSTREFRRKLAEGRNFLTNVVHRPKLFLIGSDNELGRLAEIRLAQAPQDEPRRNRGTGGRR
jgi:predicted nucleotidyltransferase